MRAQGGFTLVEVLVATGLLLITLSFVGVALSRHLSVIDRLSESARAGDLAEELVIREWIRRKEGLQLPESAPRPGHTGQLALREVTLQPEPVRGMILEEAVAEVSWAAGGRSGDTRIATGFAPSEQGPSGE